MQLDRRDIGEVHKANTVYEDTKKNLINLSCSIIYDVVSSVLLVSI